MTIEWISKEEAGVRLNLSTRRVLELAKDGRLQSAKVTDPKIGQQVVRIQAESVERYLDALQMMPDPEVRGGHAEGTLIRPRAERTLSALLDLLRDSHADRTRKEIMRLWLTLEEAEDYSGLPATLLLVWIKSGKLPAMDVGVRRGGRWRIRRVDLEGVEPLRDVITQLN